MGKFAYRFWQTTAAAKSCAVLTQWRRPRSACGCGVSSSTLSCRCSTIFAGARGKISSPRRCVQELARRPALSPPPPFPCRPSLALPLAAPPPCHCQRLTCPWFRSDDLSAGVLQGLHGMLANDEASQQNLEVAHSQMLWLDGLMAEQGADFITGDSELRRPVFVAIVTARHRRVVPSVSET